MPQQVLRRAWHAMPCQVFRRGTDHAEHLAEIAGDQGRVRQGSAEGDQHVQAFLEQGRGALGQREVDGDVRMAVQVVHQ